MMREGSVSSQMQYTYGIEASLTEYSGTALALRGALHAHRLRLANAFSCFFKLTQ